MSGLEETARSHYQNGEYAQALSAWLELSQNFPGRDDYLVSSGNCFDALGDKKAAAGYYLKAHKVNKKSLPALTNLAIACYETGDLKAAEKYSRRALKLDAESLPALINLGNVFYRRKDYAAALQYYRQAAELRSGYYVAEINLANTYFELRDYAAAAKHAESAAALDSGSVQAWTLLGNAALENGVLTRRWTLLPKRRKSILPIPGYTIIFRRLIRKNRSGKKRSKTAGRLWKKAAATKRTT